MKFNLAILALVGTISATQLTQLKGDDKKGSPDNSREIFEKQVAEAAQVVATQQSFEKTKVADVNTRNVKDTAEADAVLLHVRQAANKNLMGKNESQPKNQQWPGYEVGLVQLSAEPAAKPEAKEVSTEKDALGDESAKAGAPVPEAPKSEKNGQQVGTPQFSYEAKMNARTKNAAVLGRQAKEEAANTKEHDLASAQYAADAEAAKYGVKTAASVRRAGGMVYGERALTQ